MITSLKDVNLAALCTGYRGDCNGNEIVPGAFRSSNDKLEDYMDFTDTTLCHKLCVDSKPNKKVR